MPFILAKASLKTTFDCIAAMLYWCLTFFHQNACCSACLDRREQLDRNFGHVISDGFITINSNTVVDR